MTLLLPQRDGGGADVRSCEPFTQNNRGGEGVCKLFTHKNGGGGGVRHLLTRMEVEEVLDIYSQGWRWWR
jgi:hypothetical protein